MWDGVPGLFWSFVGLPENPGHPPPQSPIYVKKSGLEPSHKKNVHLHHLKSNEWKWNRWTVFAWRRMHWKINTFPVVWVTCHSGAKLGISNRAIIAPLSQFHKIANQTAGPTDGILASPPPVPVCISCVLQKENWTRDLAPQNLFDTSGETNSTEPCQQRLGTTTHCRLLFQYYQGAKPEKI